MKNGILGWRKNLCLCASSEDLSLRFFFIGIQRISRGFVYVLRKEDCRTEKETIQKFARCGANERKTQRSVEG